MPPWDWVIPCCFINSVISVLNLPLPFLLFGDTPSTLKIWAISALILFNLNILLFIAAHAYFPLTYVFMLAFFGLLHGLSGLSSEMINSPVITSWYIKYTVVIASIPIAIAVFAAFIYIWSYSDFPPGGVGNYNEVRSKVRLVIGYSQLLIVGSSAYLLIKALDQNPELATWSWITFGSITSFWCVFPWLVEKFHNYVISDGLEQHRRKYYGIFSFYCFIATPFMFFLPFGIPDSTPCSPVLMNFFFYLTFTSLPGFMILFSLPFLLCIKRGQHGNNEAAQPFSLSEYDNQQIQPPDQAALHKYYIEITLEETMGNKECAICWEDFQKDQQLVKITECQHSFHRECLSQWTLRDQSCPVCRMRIVKNPPQIPSN